MFVAVYQKALKLLYVDELLERMNRAFAPRYKPGCFEYPDFDATFQVGLNWLPVRPALVGLEKAAGSVWVCCSIGEQGGGQVDRVQQ